MYGRWRVFSCVFYFIRWTIRHVLCVRHTVLRTFSPSCGLGQEFSKRSTCARNSTRTITCRRVSRHLYHCARRMFEWMTYPPYAFNGANAPRQNVVLYIHDAPTSEIRSTRFIYRSCLGAVATNTVLYRVLFRRDKNVLTARRRRTLCRLCSYVCLKTSNRISALVLCINARDRRRFDNFECANKILIGRSMILVEAVKPDNSATRQW